MKHDFIKIAPIFAGLSEQEIEAVAAGFSSGQSSTGSKLLSASETSDAIYLIGQGFVRLTSDGGYNLATLGPGSVLGDASLLRAKAQDVSAIAATEVEFWKLSDRSLRQIILQHPDIGLKLSQNFGSQVVQMEEYLLQRLSTIPELSALPRNTLQAIAAQLTPRRLTTNQSLYRAGETPNNLYIVEKGAVDIRPETGSDGEGSQQVQPGAILGSLALLTGKPYTHSATANGEGLVWVISAESFQTINSRHPGLRRNLGRNLRTRLSRADQGQASMRLSQMPLFAELPTQTLAAIAQRIYLQHIPSGERVYRSGDSGDALYLIESGEIDLTGENSLGVLEERARVGAGGFFGEMSLLSGQGRSEDATALRNSNLWVLQKSDLDELAVQSPAIGKALSQGLATRLASEPDDSDRFRRFGLLSELNRGDLQQIAEVLRPTRFRAGEQIYRINTPSDTLYLIERGQVRIQPINGGNWMMGPGEEFGERSLLTNQPHNASATAESDVELWTLSKRDFDMLMKRNAALGLNMSRILSQRLQQPAQQDQYQDGYEYDDVDVAPAANVGAGSRRWKEGSPPPLQRRQAPPSARRGSFGQWFANLSAMGKINAILLLLLLLFLLGVVAPAALLQMLPSSGVANGASAYAPLQALRKVMQLGSYDLAATDSAAARALAIADSQIPPTPTYTPFPTPTPVVLIAAESQSQVVTSGEQPVFVENYAAAEIAQPFVVDQPVAIATTDPNAAAAAAAAPQPPFAPSLIWDPRLDQLGVKRDEVSVAPGQQYWKLVEARWEDEQEAGGKHHLFVEVLDENGIRIVGHPVTAVWGDGSFTGPTEDKTPPDYSWNYQMYAAGYAYSVKVEGLPSDIVKGAGMGDLERRFYGIHTAYYFTFRKTTK